MNPMIICIIGASLWLLYCVVCTIRSIMAEENPMALFLFPLMGGFYFSEDVHRLFRWLRGANKNA